MGPRRLLYLGSIEDNSWQIMESHHLVLLDD